MLSLPTIMPMPLQVRPEPRDHADWVFELKYDGFRALAYIDADGCRFMSRNGNVFKSFQVVADSLGRCSATTPRS